MAILYVLHITKDFGELSPYPPTMAYTTAESPQALKLISYLEANTVNVYTEVEDREALVFSDLDSLNRWLDEYTISDPMLKEDIKVWGESNNVSYSFKYYEISDDTSDYVNVVDTHPSVTYRGFF